MEAISKPLSTQPALFRFKIDSFSSLSKSSSIERFESCEFEAGDYKWKLAIYGNGNDKGGGNDHISLYLVLADSSCLDDNKELLVSFCLLLFDQILLKYLKVHVISSFHATKFESGFDRLLPLNIFNDPSNGYLMDDTCVFGAEVCSIESTNKKQCLPETEKIKHDMPFKFTWKLEEFSEHKDEGYMSEKFTVAGHDLKLFLFPKGCGSEKGKSVSLYLWFDDFKKLSSAKKVHVKFTLRMMDQVNKKHKEKASEKTFSSGNIFCGFPDFLSLKKLDMSTGYLVNDTCIFQAYITECEQIN